MITMTTNDIRSLHPKIHNSFHNNVCSYREGITFLLLVELKVAFSLKGTRGTQQIHIKELYIHEIYHRISSILNFPFKLVSDTTGYCLGVEWLAKRLILPRLFGLA